MSNYHQNWKLLHIVWLNGLTIDEDEFALDYSNFRVVICVDLHENIRTYLVNDTPLIMRR